MTESALTQGIRVEVESFFVPEQSDSKNHLFFFSYHIRIRNEADRPVQLLNRRWLITDGSGRTQEVEGSGVVGQQPELRPGEVFEYQSFCPLSTPTGTMRGTYEMICLKSGEKFDIEIPQFFLVEPSSFH